MDQWIQVFRTGKHTDSEGKEKEWTGEDLDRIVAKYDPLVSEAPVVIGHPKDNAPAFGWVEDLKREGKILYAKLKDLVPEFVDMVRRGLFKKRSISLHPDLTIRHIGFLGAMPPAIKGLEDIHFMGREEITINFSEDIEGFTNLQKGETIMSNSKTRNPERELQRRINEVLRNPPLVDKHGRRFSEGMTYSQALTYVQEEDPDLAREYAESVHPPNDSRQETSVAAGNKIVEFVEEKMKKDKTLTYSEALVKVQFENPNLIREYLSPGQLKVQVAHRRATNILKDAHRAGTYAEKTPKNISYRQALEIVLQEDPELAQAYADGLDSNGGMTQQREKAQAAINKIMSLVEKEREADGTLSYSEALRKVHKKNPELVREYQD
jgi:hypothetical protein